MFPCDSRAEVADEEVTETAVMDGASDGNDLSYRHAEKTYTYYYKEKQKMARFRLCQLRIYRETL